MPRRISTESSRSPGFTGAEANSKAVASSGGIAAPGKRAMDEPTLSVPHDFPQVTDRLFDHRCRHIEMRAGADPSVHHGKPHTTLAQFGDHLVAGDTSAVGLEIGRAHV